MLALQSHGPRGAGCRAEMGPGHHSADVAGWKQRWALKLGWQFSCFMPAKRFIERPFAAGCCIFASSLRLQRRGLSRQGANAQRPSKLARCRREVGTSGGRAAETVHEQPHVQPGRRALWVQGRGGSRSPKKTGQPCPPRCAWQLGNTGCCMQLAWPCICICMQSRQQA